MKLPPRLRRRKRAAPQADGRRRALTLATASLIGLLVLVVTVQIFRSALPRIMDLFDRGNRIDLAYLPPDAEFLVVIRPARVWSSPVFEACRAHPEYSSRLSTLWKLAGLRPEQVDFLTFAAKGVSRSPGAEQEAILEQFVAVFRCRRDIPAPAAVKGLASAEPVTVDGIEYVRLVPESGKHVAAIAAWRADATTLVIGAEQLVRDAIPSGGDTERRADLDFINPKHDLLVVFAPETPRGLEKTGLGALLLELRGSTVDSLSRHLRAVSFGVALSRDRRLEAIGVCRDGEAPVLQSGVESLLGDARESLAESLSSADENWRRLYHLALKTVDSAAPTRSGETVTISAEVPMTVESILRHRGIGRSHRLLYRPLDWTFAWFPASSFLAEFEQQEPRSTDGAPDESMNETTPPGAKSALRSAR